ncbi:MAG: PD40 domain-containing protein [Candidatus Latescibacteria bacterium]|nr:PD40 domain-containing protein [Candidatus Latescibacterota bacterium]
MKLNLAILLIIFLWAISGCEKSTGPRPFVIDPNLQQLTFHDYDKFGTKWRGDALFPVWAPDDRIYYIRSNLYANPAHQGGGGDIWVIDVAGETDTLLVKGVFGSSPDGQWLLAVDNYYFVRVWNMDENGAWYEVSGGILTLINLETLNIKVIPTDPLKVREATFFPDSTGLAIAYYGYSSSSLPDGYYRINVDGTDNQLLYACEDFRNWYYGNGLDISPDGRRIVYISSDERRDGTYFLPYPPVIKDLVTLDQVALEFAISWPRFNSDGSRIVCNMHARDEGMIGIIDGYNGSLIKTLNIEAYDPQRVGRTYAFFPCWSPDGTKIVFSEAPNPYVRVHDLWILNNVY